MDTSSNNDGLYQTRATGSDNENDDTAEMNGLPHTYAPSQDLFNDSVVINDNKDENTEQNSILDIQNEESLGINSIVSDTTILHLASQLERVATGGNTDTENEPTAEIDTPESIRRSDRNKRNIDYKTLNEGAKEKSVKADNTKKMKAVVKENDNNNKSREGAASKIISSELAKKDKIIA